MGDILSFPRPGSEEGQGALGPGWGDRSQGECHCGPGWAANASLLPQLWDDHTLQSAR